MTAKTIFAAMILCAAGWNSAAAQVADRTALYASLGLTRSGGVYHYAGSADVAPSKDLTPDQSRRVEKIVASADGGQLTDAGRAAVVAIVREEPSADAAEANAAPAGGPTADPTAPAARVSALLAGVPNANFDGSSSSSELPDAPVPAGTSSSLAGLQPSTVKALAVSKPKPTPLEKDLFWSSWYAYHAAWAADFTTTGLILNRGGYEKDRLYTQFGNKNMPGVIGSAAAVHVVASLASYAIYKEAQKKRGVWRRVLNAAADGINVAGAEIHTQAAAGNVGVMRNWNR